MWNIVHYTASARMKAPEDELLDVVRLLMEGIHRICSIYVQTLISECDTQKTSIKSLQTATITLGK